MCCNSYFLRHLFLGCTGLWFMTAGDNESDFQHLAFGGLRNSCDSQRGFTWSISASPWAGPEGQLCPLKLFILCSGCSNVAFTPQQAHLMALANVSGEKLGETCQELWLKYKKCNQTSYLWDFFKSTRNPSDTLSLSVSAMSLGNRISPMTEGFLKQKENMKVITAWIQSFPSLHLHCADPILKN